MHSVHDRSMGTGEGAGPFGDRLHVSWTPRRDNLLHDNCEMYRSWPHEVRSLRWRCLELHQLFDVHCQLQRVVFISIQRSAMALMFLGEITAPIMNLVRISQAATRSDMSNAGLLSSALPATEYVFAILYIVFRVVLGPICAVHLTHDLLLQKEGRRNVPVQLSVIWLAICWGVLWGSIPWIKNAFAILSRTGSAIA